MQQEHPHARQTELERRISRNLNRARALATDSEPAEQLRRSRVERELRTRLVAGGRHALVSHRREVVGTIRVHRFPVEVRPPSRMPHTQAAASASPPGSHAPPTMEARRSSAYRRAGSKKSWA